VRFPTAVTNPPIAAIAASRRWSVVIDAIAIVWGGGVGVRGASEDGEEMDDSSEKSGRVL
jgi:hypothetical protein